MPDKAPSVNLALPREDMQAVWEVVVARAVNYEDAEAAIRDGLGSIHWRRRADAIRAALDDALRETAA